MREARGMCVREAAVGPVGKVGCRVFRARGRSQYQVLTWVLATNALALRPRASHVKTLRTTPEWPAQCPHHDTPHPRSVLVRNPTLSSPLHPHKVLIRLYSTGTSSAHAAASNSATLCRR
jgi:hypothetical protein